MIDPDSFPGPNLLQELERDRGRGCHIMPAIVTNREPLGDGTMI